MVPESISALGKSPPARRDLALDTLAHSFARDTGFPMLCYAFSLHLIDSAAWHSSDNQAVMLKDQEFYEFSLHLHT